MPLWIVATPIGTLGDMSPRAREVIAAADLLCAEDTRTTKRLLSALEVAAPRMRALHAHNEAQVADGVVERAREHDVVLVSDAGTPGISDPGRALVEAALAAGVQVLSVPGPSALAAALAASGFPAAPSSFLGFPPRKGRDGWVAAQLARPGVLVVYEAPNRMPDLVARFAAAAPDREACLAREISKRFEEILRLPLPQLATQLADRTLKGECVLVVGPGEALAAEAAPDLEADASLKDIAAVLAQRWGTNKRDAYQRLLAIERELAADR